MNNNRTESDTLHAPGFMDHHSRSHNLSGMIRAKEGRIGFLIDLPDWLRYASQPVELSLCGKGIALTDPPDWLRCASQLVELSLCGKRIAR